MEAPAVGRCHLSTQKELPGWLLQDGQWQFDVILVQQ